MLLDIGHWWWEKFWKCLSICVHYISQSEKLFKRRTLEVYIMFLKLRDNDWYTISLPKSTFKQKASWRGLETGLLVQI